MMDHLWTAYEAAAATGGALCARGGDPKRWVAEEWAARGLSIDTRTLEPGEIFVALKDARDGHEFLGSAFQRGAAAALVARAPADAPEGAPLLVVSDTEEGLRDLARAARMRNFGKRIGVTGSVGKTSTKEMLRTVLSASGRVHAAAKSFNNHWGVPLTLASLPMDAEFGVFEIGMNHSGEITPLTGLVAPHAAIVTAIAPAHLAHFSSVEEIAEAKAEIFLGVEPGGAAVLPADSDYYELLAARAGEAGIARRITFGETAGADFRLLDARPSSEGQIVEADIEGRIVTFALGAAGRHQATNALAALAASLSIGAELEASLAAFANFSAGAGRGGRREMTIKGARISLIDESYNANPASMAAAIALLGASAPAGEGRRIAVLGDMLELGADEATFHADLVGPLGGAKVDQVFAAGERMRHLWNALPGQQQGAYAANASEIAAKLLEDLRDGDIILVKGSNASKVSDVISILEKECETG